MIRLLLISFLMAITFIGCGEGGNSSPVTGVSTVTGQFVDAPVEGLGYVCSSGTTGKTNANGEYTCNEGDSVTFKIGTVVIGTTFAQTTAVTPYTLFPSNSVAAVNLARLLQSVDAGTSSGRIVIDTALEAIIPADTDFTSASFEATTQTALGKTLVSAIDAQTIMNDAIATAGGSVPAGTEVPLLSIDEILHYLSQSISSVGQTIMDEYFSYAWHIEDKSNNFATSNEIDSFASANIKEAWTITRGQGVLVAVIDDSFNASHEDLKDNVIATYNAKTGKSIVVDQTLTLTHGTTVSGIVAASANNKGVIGVAPDAKLLLIAIGDGASNSDLTIIDAFEYARTHGAHVVSCSWGTESVSEAVGVKIKELYDEGITIVFASGNSGKDLDSEGVSDESELPWVIGVGSSNERNTKIDSSNYGKSIDVLAPSGEGIGIVTTDEMGVAGKNSGSETLVGENYTFLKGTSASAPIVSGVVALLLSERADLTPAQIRYILVNSTDKIGDVTYNENGWNSQYAYGKINAYKALQNINSVPAATEIVVEEAEVTNADPDRVSVDVEYRGTWDVSGSSPSNGATGVDINIHPTMTGNGDPINSGTVSSSTVILQYGNGTATGISLSYSVSGNTITSTPSQALQANTAYIMRYTTGLRDTKGDSLGGNTNRTFTTGAPADTTPPTLTSVSITSNNGVDTTKAMPGDQITVTFTANEALNTGSTTATIAGQSATIATVSGTTYTAKYTMTSGASDGNIAFSITAVDVAANSASAVTSVTDASAVTFDKTGPSVNLPISPAANATGVAIDSTVVFTFSEAMNNATLTTANISINNGVTGSVGISGNTVTFTPDAPLANLTAYTLTVTVSVTDAIGNPMTSEFTSGFTTVASDVTPPTISSTTPINSATDVSIGSNITITFDEVMNSATLTSANISISPAATAAFSDDGTTVTINPTGNLATSTTYTVTVGTGVTDATGNAIAEDSFSFTTEAPDTTSPTISSHTPTADATGVAINSNITITFNEPMDSATLTATNITLDGSSFPGAVSDDGTTVTLNPTTDFIYGQTYTVAVTTIVKDVSGNAIAAGNSFSFTAFTESVPPTISSISPSDTQTDVSLNANVVITFSEDMKSSTINGTNVTLKDSTNANVDGVLSLNGNVATFDPTVSFEIGETYTLTVGTGVTDLIGNALVSESVTTFTAVISACTQTANPTVCYTVPENSAIAIGSDTSVAIRFSEEMSAGMNTTNIVLKNSSDISVPGTVSYNGFTATFEPNVDLSQSETYTLVIATGVIGATTGNNMSAQYSMSFTTSSGVSNENVRDGVNNIVILPETSRMWQDDANVLTARSWADASTYCADSTLGGYSDWYLPNVNELRMLADEMDEDLSLFQNTVNGYFWSSEEYSGNTSRALDVRFNNGSVNHYGKLNSDYVRCTRSTGGSEAGSDTADVASGIVTMNSTALVWQDNGYNTKTDWATAVSYCESLTLATFSDWRLPTIVELGGIVDGGDEGTTAFINSVFQTAEMDGYWSSTSVARPTTDAKYIDFYSGVEKNGNKTSSAYIARCVRNK